MVVILNGKTLESALGRGLVGTPDDFGVNGARPTHPELLDDLSVRFMESNWSTKFLIRELVLSRTYQLASSLGVRDAAQTTQFPAEETRMLKDPDNVYLWRMTPRRLEAEILRDAILTVTGNLELRPPTAEQAFLARRHPHRDAEYFNFKPPFQASDIEHPYRSVYLPVVRGILPPVFQLFDFAAPDRPVAQRDVSTVPSQALFLMNNAWVIEQSQRAARRLLSESNHNDEQRVQFLFQLAYARRASEAELVAVIEYLNSGESLLNEKTNAATATSEQVHQARWNALCQVIFASAEFRVLK